MNKFDEINMQGYSIGNQLCVFCGRPANSRHHVVYRSHGGVDGPTIAVCGLDNVTGCHGLLHQHFLHIRFNPETQVWEYLRTRIQMKDSEAYELDGWIELRRFKK